MNFDGFKTLLALILLEPYIRSNDQDLNRDIEIYHRRKNWKKCTGEYFSDMHH